jgi:hypothetical protein
VTVDLVLDAKFLSDADKEANEQPGTSREDGAVRGG